jgi:hypothetical protein
MENKILLENNLISLVEFYSVESTGSFCTSRINLATFINNVSYYGYFPSKKLFSALEIIGDIGIISLWENIRSTFDVLSGNNKSMGDFVVYKNFPNETLSTSESEYWINQVLIYFGINNDFITENKKLREDNSDFKVLKILNGTHRPSDQLTSEYLSLTGVGVRWSDNQRDNFMFLISALNILEINVSLFGFKENGIVAANELLDKSIAVNIQDATDVLRLAALMSNQDISLRNSVKFKRFNRPERRKLLSILDNTNNLESDFADRPEMWKRFLSFMHPNDYSFKNVSRAYDFLYNGVLNSFEYLFYSYTKDFIRSNKNKVELYCFDDVDGDIELKSQLLKIKDSANTKYGLTPVDKEIIFERLVVLLNERKGEFLRRFHHLYNIFGNVVVAEIVKIFPSITTHKLLKFEKYITTINTRKTLIYTPRGNWSHAKFYTNGKIIITNSEIFQMVSVISDIINKRLGDKSLNGVSLSEDVKRIKIQSSDQELGDFGRGTSFDIPDSVMFLRSATYWKVNSTSNIWFDNGWNFFDEKMNSLGVCCWDNVEFDGAAVFSGDPASSRTVTGEACQMIDLYIDKLLDKGVRYAIWGLLSYNKMSFSSVDEVFAALQWGEDSLKGELFDPSRVQMSFPINGDGMSKYIAYIDIVERKLVFMDANLSATLNSASSNSELLSNQLASYSEYLSSIPSVYDLFKHYHEGDTKVLYTDKDIIIGSDEDAYVFNRENAMNDFNLININNLLK